MGAMIVSNHQPHLCLLNCLFRRRSKKISKLRVTGLFTENAPATGEFPAQMDSNAENVPIWWRHPSNAAVLSIPHACVEHQRDVWNADILWPRSNADSALCQEF